MPKSRCDRSAAGACACRRPRRAPRRPGRRGRPRPGCTIARPRPEPGMAARRAARGRSGRRRSGRSSVGDARAVVAHGDLAVAHARPRPRRRAGSTSRRCRAGSRPRARVVAGTPCDERLARGRRRNATPGRLRRARSTASAASRSSRTSSGLRLRAARRGRARPARRRAPSSRRAARPRRRAAARAPPAAASSLACEHLDVRAQARQRRAQLVRGVGDELALRAARLLERGEHRVEARGEPAELVLGRRTRCAGRGRRVAVTLLGGLGEPPDRRERGARRRASPSAPASPIPPSATIRIRSACAGERVVDLVSGRATWSAKPGRRRA